MKVTGVFIMICMAVLAQTKPSVADLRWLTGSWEMVNGERKTEEVWLAPEGNMMFSMSRTVRNGKAAGHEFVTIDQDSAGTIWFHAQPSGQERGSFRLILLERNGAVFENRAHDFPQRIIYRRISDDSLIGRIEGTINGTSRSIDFPYRKIIN
jgi:hypothetical protein